MAGCISCIKDGVTGECRDLKDKTARIEIDQIKEQIKNISGSDPGKTYATSEELQELNTRFDTRLNLAESEIAFSSRSISQIKLDMQELEGQMSNMGGGGSNSVVIYDKDSTDEYLNWKKTSGIDTTYAYPSKRDGTFPYIGYERYEVHVSIAGSTNIVILEGQKKSGMNYSTYKQAHVIGNTSTTLHTTTVKVSYWMDGGVYYPGFNVAQGISYALANDPITIGSSNGKITKIVGYNPIELEEN